MRIRDRFLNVGRWLLFSVIIALLPIIYNALILYAFKQPVTLDNTLSHGELLLVSTAILAEASGDLLLNDKAYPIIKVFLSGLNLVVFGMACLLFSSISSNATLAASSGRKIDTGVVAYYSFAVFIWTILSGVSCKWIAER